MTTSTMPTLIAEIAFSTGAADVTYLHLDDTVRGKLDTAILAPTDYFVDVAATVRSGSTVRGSQRFQGPYARSEAGHATLELDNRSRAYDPTNLSGPYVAAGVTQVVPMRVFRIRATYNAITYDLWRGFADEWRLAYTNPRDATATLTGTDGTKVISNFDGVAGGAVGAGEDTGARISRVLTNANWPAADVALDTGQTTVQSTDLSANAWTEVLLNADTEFGEVYFDATGKVVFRRRQAILTDTRSSTSQATFGDAAGEVPYANVEIAYDDLQVRNLIRITRVGGTQQSVTDTASVTKYQKKTWGRTDLIMQTDAEALNYANYVLALNDTAELRFATLTLMPQRNPATLWPQALGRELGDRITVKFTPPGGGTRIIRDCFIRGITHTFTGDRWVTTFALQDATKFAFFVLNSATLGLLDTDALGY